MSCRVPLAPLCPLPLSCSAVQYPQDEEQFRRAMWGFNGEAGGSGDGATEATVTSSSGGADSMEVDSGIELSMISSIS